MLDKPTQTGRVAIIPTDIVEGLRARSNGLIGSFGGYFGAITGEELCGECFKPCSWRDVPCLNVCHIPL